MMQRLLAVDPSLTCSGWALFSLGELGAASGNLLAVGKVKSLAAALPLPLRLKDLQSKVTSIFDRLMLTENDVLVCEAPTTMRDPRAAFKVEQVRGIFETIARSRSVRVPGRLNPRSVQYDVMGLRGRQLERQTVKQTATRIVQTVYGPALAALGFESDTKNLLRNQDIVDAILIGSLAVARVKASIEGMLEIENCFEPKRRVGKRMMR